ncbi:MAG: hypothetical protein WD988_02075 [Candidatus Curtissbacteria bacterium]
MKQLTLTEVLKSLEDQPSPIGARLESLGLTAEELAGQFSKEILETSVYGSSFLKFLNDNRDKLSFEQDIAPEELPADFKNAFDDTDMTIGERLAAMDMDASDIFGAEVLSLSVNSQEFQDFILQNQEKFLAKLDQMAQVEGGTS